VLLGDDPSLVAAAAAAGGGVSADTASVFPPPAPWRTTGAIN